MAADKPDPHRFTADDFHRMEAAGILGGDDQVELVDGQIVEVAPDPVEHPESVARVGAAISAAVGDRATVRQHCPVAVGGLSEPEADVCVVLGEAGDHDSSGPRPSDVLLVVEVCETAVSFDDDVKGPIYAKAGIIENWIVDVAAGVVLVARDPQPCGYMDKRRLTAGETVTPLMLPGATVAVADLI